ncbi:MAG: hypothetical protein CM1200mP26_24960 [Acidimicrobiales bacterium]|nr:MAG: hypothetical protein CM1200mP26_24960 [Acidimicrobiales bacterium]
MATDQALADEIVGTIRSWVDRDVIPNVAEFEQVDEFPQAMFDQMCEFGLFGSTVAPEYGGLGLDITTMPGSSRSCHGATCLWLAFSTLTRSASP